MGVHTSCFPCESCKNSDNSMHAWKILVKLSNGKEYASKTKGESVSGVSRFAYKTLSLSLSLSLCVVEYVVSEINVLSNILYLK